MKNTIFLKPGKKDYTAELVSYLLYAADDTEISFETGEYHFSECGSYNRYFTPVCNRSGDKKVVFPILNRKNIVINGNGSLFVFEDRVFPFIIHNCENITLKNFSVTFSFLRYGCATILNCDQNGVLLHIDEKTSRYDTNEDGNLIFYAGSDIFSTEEKRFFLKQKVGEQCFLVAGKYYYDTSDRPAEFVFANARRQDGNVYLEYTDESYRPQFKTEVPLIISYDEIRDNDCIYFEKSQNCRVENVNILRCQGMGIIFQMCENCTVYGCRIAPPEGEIFSSTADALFFTNCSGDILVENTTVDSSMDDALSVHGIYTQIERICCRNKLLVRFKHRSHYGAQLYRAGDVVRVTDKDNMNEKCELTVKSTEFLDDLSVVYITFAQDISQLVAAGDFLENISASPSVVIRNNVFKNFPGIRLASEKAILFENNTVKNGAHLMVNDLVRYWYAYGCSKNVVIRNNSIENCACGVTVVRDRVEESMVKHENITMCNNTIKNCPTGIYCEYVENLHIYDNDMESVPDKFQIKHCTLREKE